MKNSKNIDNPLVSESNIEVDKYSLINSDLLLKRFFARSIDYVFFTIIVLFFIIFFHPIYYDKYFEYGTPIDFYLFLFVPSCFLWIFIESLLICLFKTTPGKLLFNLYVVKDNNIKLSFLEALSRSFRVWLLGYGMGIFSKFTMIYTFFTMPKDSRCSWDKNNNSKIIYSEVKFIKGLIIAIVIGVLLSMEIYSKV